MSKKGTGLIKCEQLAETPGKLADPNANDCQTKVIGKYDGGVDPTKGCFEKLENKNPNDCISFNDTGSTELLVDSCVGAFVEAIDPGTIDQTKCGAGKKKCVSKYFKARMKCYQLAQTPGKPTDPNANSCLDKAVAKYTGGVDPTKGCFYKLENKSGNDCIAPTGNSATLQGLVEDCVNDLVDAVANPPTTTTSSSSTSSSSSSTAAPTTSSSSTAVPTTSSSSTAVPTTSSSSTAVPTTSSSSTVAPTTTTSSTVPSPTFLDFTSTVGSGTCGQTLNGSSVQIRTLDCGKLYLGGGSSTVAPNATPDGGINRFALSCAASNCTISSTNTAPALNTSTPDCTNTGCNFGTPLPVPASSATCVINTFASPAGGTLNLATGVANQTISLNSAVFLSGNQTNPCPQCSATGTPSSPGTGTCNRGPRAGLTCVTTNSSGLTRDCPPGAPSESAFGSIPIVLGTVAAPLTTGTSTKTQASGNFCTGQGNPPVNGISGFSGCFGSSGAGGGGSACRTITETGTPAGALAIGTPANVTLASTFCVPATSNISVNIVGDLPGPGATTLTGVFRTQ